MSKTAWYHEAIFYHIYPLGMSGAPKQNSYQAPVHRLNSVASWIPHIQELGCNAIYIGPLFESVGHGYETTDYRKVDSRLGANEDLKAFVAECHRRGLRVVLDGVFNHVGRDFFAFQDVKAHREHSQYKDWFCNINFWGDNSFHDGFSYENWGGYDLLVKLNQCNPQVRDYICDVIRFWVSEFDIDGIRLDAADVLDFHYMKALRRTANEVKEDFWLMGEVIHGDYSRWVNTEILHSVTNYMLHKALYSGHNDHNYFEIAHTVKHVSTLVGDVKALYSFVDNHDVERIYTKLKNKAHFFPVHVLLYTLPGIPSIYYGSEFGIEGKKESFSDDSLRPALNFEDYKDAAHKNPYTKLIAALGKLRQATPALSYGDYEELLLQTTHYAFARVWEGKGVIVAVNNSDHDVSMDLPCGSSQTYVGALSGERVTAADGRIRVKVAPNSGEIWVPTEHCSKHVEPVKPIETAKEPEQANPMEKAKTPEQAIPVEAIKEAEPAKPVEAAKEAVSENKIYDLSKPYEEMSIEELQESILEKMRKNGPVTEYMLGTVRENTHRGSLITWAKSF